VSPFDKVVVVTSDRDPQSPGRRPRRADARRNRERLVEQARASFAEFGVNASLDEIARRAGVASGTLYRHFPTRLDLVEAVLADQIAELVELGRRLLTAEDELAALSTWLRAAILHGVGYRGLSTAVMTAALDRGSDLVSTWHAEMFEAGAALLARARSARVIVAEADDGDVLRMVGAIAWAAQDSPDSSAQAERLLSLLLDGLRRRGAARGQ
jgi:AcrR family transcriptional regulator